MRAPLPWLGSVVAAGLAGCTSAPPPTPPPLAPDAGVRAARVQYAGVSGLLVQPPEATPVQRAELWIGPLDADQTARARQSAAAATRILVIEPGTDPTAAQTYLDGLRPPVPSVGPCPRGDCSTAGAPAAAMGAAD